MIITTTAVYSNDNGFSLVPYVNDNGEIWLKSTGNGCGDDVMVQDVEGWTSEEIMHEYESIDTDAMLVAADEIEAAGDCDNAEWIRGWCGLVKSARVVE